MHRHLGPLLASGIVMSPATADELTLYAAGSLKVALAQEAPLIVMDEPTASLDFGNRAQVLARISALVHDPDQAFALDARVLMMKDGRIHADGRAEDVLTETALSAVYGIPVSIEKTPSGRKVCLASPGRRSASAVKADAGSGHARCRVADSRRLARGSEASRAFRDPDGDPGRTLADRVGGSSV